MFKYKSVYSLNKKDTNAIVYPCADGTLCRLTRKDFASEAEFLYWKERSDRNYHKQEKADHIQANHSISLESLPEKVTAVVSPELTMIDRQDRLDREQLRQLLLAGLDSCLTSTQRRRLWLYCVERWAEKRISLSENVTQQSVSECIAAARKKIFYFLMKNTL